MRTIDDDVLFKVLAVQTSIADDARKRGKFRPASASLGRAFQEGALRANAGQPAGRLACASVRLQSCTMLSKTNKHAEALEEACAAVLEIDKLWKDLTMANGHAQAAVRDHRCVEEAMKKVPLGLRELMSRPPKWLEQAITVSIEAKHCVALELEFCVQSQEPIDLLASPISRPRTASATGRRDKHLQVARQGRPHSAPGAGDSAKLAELTPPSYLAGDDDVACALGAAKEGVRHLQDPWGMIERLHAEASSLAEVLLPPGHLVMERSRRTEWQARGRNPALIARLAREAEEAAHREAEAARRRAAEEAERSAAAEAAQRAAEEEAARLAAEEAARQAAMWRANRELAKERAEQIVVQREKPEVEREQIVVQREKPEVGRLKLGVDMPAAHEATASPRSKNSDKPRHLGDALPLSNRNRNHSARDATPSPRSKNLAMPLHPGEDRKERTFTQSPRARRSPRPLPELPPDDEVTHKRRASASFLKDCFTGSAAGNIFHRVVHEQDNLEGMARVDNMMAMGGGETANRDSIIVDPEWAEPQHSARDAARPTSSAGQRLRERTTSCPAIRGRELEPDMFQQWRVEQSHYENQSYIQKKLGSEPGVQDMKGYLRSESTRFVNGYLKETSPDNLYDCRINFTPSMVAERKRQQERHGLGLDVLTDYEPQVGASTAQLHKAMRRTWASLYGFRDEGALAKKRANQANVLSGILGAGATLLGNNSKAEKKPERDHSQSRPSSSHNSNGHSRPGSAPCRPPSKPQAPLPAWRPAGAAPVARLAAPVGKTPTHVVKS